MGGGCDSRPTPEVRAAAASVLRPAAPAPDAAGHAQHAGASAPVASRGHAAVHACMMCMDLSLSLSLSLSTDGVVMVVATGYELNHTMKPYNGNEFRQTITAV